MSVSDEFVKLLAAVTCDHTVTIPIGWMADTVDPSTGEVTKGDNRAPEIRAAEAKAAAEARCVFCIARKAIGSIKLCGVDRREAGPCPNQIPCHTHGMFI